MRGLRGVTGQAAPATPAALCYTGGQPWTQAVGGFPRASGAPLPLDSVGLEQVFGRRCFILEARAPGNKTMHTNTHTLGCQTAPTKGQMMQIVICHRTTPQSVPWPACPCHEKRKEKVTLGCCGAAQHF